MIVFLGITSIALGAGLLLIANAATNRIVNDLNTRRPPDRQIARKEAFFRLYDLYAEHHSTFPGSSLRKRDLVLTTLGTVLMVVGLWIASSCGVARG